MPGFLYSIKNQIHSAQDAIVKRIAPTAFGGLRLAPDPSYGPTLPQCFFALKQSYITAR